MTSERHDIEMDAAAATATTATGAKRTHHDRVLGEAASATTDNATRLTDLDAMPSAEAARTLKANGALARMAIARNAAFAEALRRAVDGAPTGEHALRLIGDAMLDGAAHEGAVRRYYPVEEEYEAVAGTLHGAVRRAVDEYVKRCLGAHTKKTPVVDVKRKTSQKCQLMRI